MAGEPHFRDGWPGEGRLGSEDARPGVCPHRQGPWRCALVSGEDVRRFAHHRYLDGLADEPFELGVDVADDRGVDKREAEEELPREAGHQPIGDDDIGDRAAQVDA